MSEFPKMISQSIMQYDDHLFVGYDETGMAFTASNFQQQVERDIVKYAERLIGRHTRLDDEEPAYQLVLTEQQKEDLDHLFKLLRGVIPTESFRPTIERIAYDLETDNLIKLDG